LNNDESNAKLASGALIYKAYKEKNIDIIKNIDTIFTPLDI